MNVFEQPFDPFEIRDFVFDWAAPLAAVGDVISTHTIALDAAASAAAVEIGSSDVDQSETKVVFWLRSADAAITSAADGGYAGVVCSVTTTGGRVWRYAARVRIQRATS